MTEWVLAAATVSYADVLDKLHSPDCESDTHDMNIFWILFYIQHLFTGAESRGAGRGRYVQFIAFSRCDCTQSVSV